MTAATPDRLLELLNALVDDALAPAERAELAEMLRESEAARRAYCEMVGLHALLQSVSARPIVPLPLGDDLPARPWRWTGFVPAAWRVPTALLGGFNAQSVGTLLFACCFYGLFMLLLWTGHWGRSPSEADPLAARSRAEDFRAEARVTQLDGARYSAEGRSWTEGRLLERGDELRLLSGRATVAMASGAELVVEGPARLEIVSSLEVLLDRGRLVAHVPPEAVGMTVRTPNAQIVDLGTEFGVFVGSNNESEVQVFEGRVEVQAPARDVRAQTPPVPDAAEPGAIQPDASKPDAESLAPARLVLHRNEAAEITGGELARASFIDGDFVESRAFLHSSLWARSRKARGSHREASGADGAIAESREGIQPGESPAGPPSGESDASKEPRELAASADVVEGTVFETDWSMPRVWSDQEPPSPGKHGHVGRQGPMRLRSPMTLDPPAFAGGALTIHPAGDLALKHAGSAVVPDLRLEGGEVTLWEERRGQPMRLRGGLHVTARSRISLHGDTLALESRLSGDAPLVVSGPGELRLHDAKSAFRGGWRIENGQLLALVLGSAGEGDIEVGAGGVLNVQYDFRNPAGALRIEVGGRCVVDWPVTWGRVTVAGVPLEPGDYPVTELKTRFPESFAGERGTLRVLPRDGPLR